MKRSRRRQFIATVATGVTGLIAGCDGRTQPNDDNTTGGGDDSNDDGGDGSIGNGNEMEETFRAYRGNASRTGYFPERTGPKDGVSEQWSFTADNTINTSPIVGNGSVYVGDGDATVYAINPTNGSVEWQTGVSKSVKATPTLADGVMYVPNGGQYLTAVDADSGDTLWEFDSEKSTIYSPAVTDQTVVVSSSQKSSDGKVAALDTADGSIRWDVEPAKGGGVAPAIVGNTVYYVGDQTAITAADVETGDTVWEKTFIGPMMGIAASDETVFVSRNAGGGYGDIEEKNARVLALDADDGSKRWSFDTGNDRISGPAAVTDDAIFVASKSTVFKANRETGEREWDASIPGTSRSVPTVYGDTIYIPSGAGKLTALDVEDGSKRWKVSFSDISTGPAPVLAGGSVYFPAWDTLLAFE